MPEGVSAGEMLLCFHLNKLNELEQRLQRHGGRHEIAYGHFLKYDEIYEIIYKKKLKYWNFKNRFVWWCVMMLNWKALQYAVGWKLFSTWHDGWLSRQNSDKKTKPI